MTKENILRLAHSYVTKSVSPFESDKLKGASLSAFIAGFATAHGMWQVKWNEVTKETSEELPVTDLSASNTSGQ